MRKVLGLALSIGLLSACTQKTGTGFQLTHDVSGIFSNRPQTATHGLFLIKLTEKPLLSSLQVQNGKTQPDPELLKAITAEQNKLINDLQALSPEIKTVYRYRLVMNGVAVVAPLKLQDKIRALGNVAYVESNGSFSRPVEALAQTTNGLTSAIQERNSVKFIGAEEAHTRGIRGQNMRVGIIDTGIDYTHAMFGGAGTEDAYKAIDPKAANSSFPSAKVVGGIDLVGTDYDSGAADFTKHIPQVDANPLDEGGHGTHVAGTVAGHGDGVNTYDGVAPDAALYAIKVFGAKGSTGDAVVIAALEYAADPNADADLSDRLDVVNLSLGSGYGEGHILYTEAIQNLSGGGTSVVCSAGNSGDSPYITGAPAVADAALSVAASVDDMDQNWKFRAVKFSTVDQPELYVEAIEGTVGKPIKDAGPVTGSLVYVGLADHDFSDEVKAQLQGKIAFIDRGVVVFAEKVRRAFEAGAIGVVVANNQPGAPLAMGGDGKHGIPAIMISQTLGQDLKAAQAKGPVSIEFQTDRRMEKPELIDTITGFSSKGPRSIDALIKPEISAPGSLVISAAMGGGQAGVALSGTSMAAPHMAGVMALLKQAHADLNAADLKSIAMNTTKTLVDEKKQTYPISRQGAGRVQILKALEASLVTLPSALSLGEMTVESRKTIQRTLEVRNITAGALNLDVKLEAAPGLSLIGPASVNLAAGQSTTLTLRFVLDMTSVSAVSLELSGLVKLTQGTTEIARVPVLAIANKVSQVKGQSLAVLSTSAADSQGAAVDLSLKNSGLNDGEAYPFNLIGRDGRKEDKTNDPFRSKACDLAESGYRVVKKDGGSFLQIAVKVYEPLTTWDSCEVSVLIDANGDGVPEQELVGIKQDHLKGLTLTTFASVLLDAGKTRELRKEFELATLAQQPSDTTAITEDYTSAVLALQPMLAFAHSTVSIIEAPIADLKLKATGELAVRIATSYLEGSAIEPDDFLTHDPKKWSKLNVSAAGAGFVDLPEKVLVKAGQTQTVSFTKGAGSEKLWLLYPTNKPVVGGIARDQQSEVMTPVFKSADHGLVASH